MTPGLDLQRQLALWNALRALALLIVANATPWAASRLLGRAERWPLDGGLCLGDGQRLFGEHKSWRGVLLGTLACAAVAPLLRLPVLLGALFGLLALLGDALSSAIKRRLGLPSGQSAPGLDQLPEATLPLFVLARSLGLEWASAAAVTALFSLLDLLSLRIRQRTRRRAHRSIAPEEGQRHR